ncbi:hypothetical protein HMPREF3216_01251 [Gardnerella vaginalis]|uniref:Uncharacterized protein n=1 Tax=Gardnerella vaginalis TaxID=2702 RepID=A0A133NM39_GARVA|nr:hypothetical protein HMPREF3216_01251 [Gardnerella vaginalis]
MRDMLFVACRAFYFMYFFDYFLTFFARFFRFVIFECLCLNITF